MSSPQEQLSALDGLKLRSTALGHAVTSHGSREASEVCHVAGVYLEWLLNGQPVQVIGGTVRVTPGEPPANVGAAPAQEAAPQAPKATRANKPRAAAGSATTASPAPSAPAPEAQAPSAVPASGSATTASTAPAAASAPTPAATPQPAAPTTVAPPISMQDAANVMRDAVQVHGKRDAVLALLTKYKVAQMTQIPPAQLAGFIAEVKLTYANPAPAVADDPMKGLI